MAASSKSSGKSWWRSRLRVEAHLPVDAITGGTLALVALIALGIAVYSTKSSLPSFDELKSSPNGQMIRVHAADGTVLVSLGPSYGEWLTYDKIPQVMRTRWSRSRIAASNRIGASIRSASRACSAVQKRGTTGPAPAGRIDDHPAGGAQYLPVEQI
jgi:hypothetical protein